MPVLMALRAAGRLSVMKPTRSSPMAMSRVSYGMHHPLFGRFPGRFLSRRRAPERPTKLADWAIESSETWPVRSALRARRSAASLGEPDAADHQGEGDGV